MLGLFILRQLPMRRVDFVKFSPNSFQPLGRILNYIRSPAKTGWATVLTRPKSDDLWHRGCFLQCRFADMSSAVRSGAAVTVLVTGLTGFVGAHCAQEVAAADLELDGRLVDLCNRQEVLEAVKSRPLVAVIHLAAQSSVPASFEDPLETYEVNFLGTLNLLLALRESGFRGRFLYVGSGDVYGVVPEAELPVSENRPLRPRNPYAVSKVAAEALCHQWSQTGPFEIVMARPFNHIGPGQSTRFAVSDFARQMDLARKGKGKEVLEVGDIDTTRDFTDVRDIVRAYKALLKAGVNGEIYNICSGIELSLREIITALGTAAGIEMQIHVDSARLRPVEQRRMRGSYERLRAHTGWEPSIPLAKTLQDILNYWHSREDV